MFVKWWSTIRRLPPDRSEKTVESASPVGFWEKWPCKSLAHEPKLFVICTRTVRREGCRQTCPTQPRNLHFCTDFLQTAIFNLPLPLTREPRVKIKSPFLSCFWMFCFRIFSRSWFFNWTWTIILQLTLMHRAIKICENLTSFVVPKKIPSSFKKKKRLDFFLHKSHKIMECIPKKIQRHWSKNGQKFKQPKYNSLKSPRSNEALGMRPQTETHFLWVWQLRWLEWVSKLMNERMKNCRISMFENNLWVNNTSENTLCGKNLKV